mgnify:CR=1 FL=1
MESQYKRYTTSSGTEFCDWYIEIAKVRTYKKDENPESANAALWTLKTVLVNALKLLHPYMPFITEEIFCTLQSDEETIMLSKWPEYKKEWNFPAEEAAIEHCKDLVKGIRNVRTQMDVPPSRKAKLSSQVMMSQSERYSRTTRRYM